jgi:hypothetical protein
MGYHTFFPNDENPISEGSRWIDAGTVGLDWTDIRTVGGLAYGTQTGSAPGSGHPNYDDSVCLLTGSWRPNQSVEGIVKTVNQNAGGFFELELWLRGSGSAHSWQGYECSWRVTSDGSQYCNVVRWNGPLSNFTSPSTNTGPGVRNGDRLKAQILGNIVTMYVNDVLCYTQDITAYAGGGNVYANGSPGLGHWRNDNGTGGIVSSDWGFRYFRARNL